jgi:aminoglycoside/choline kinase family phosphotransferase
MIAQLEIAGRPVRSGPKLFHLWGPSIVLRADTASGAAYLKCSMDLFRHEAVVTQALARSMPGLVPDVLAVEPEQGWLLMADMGGRPLGELPPTGWAVALRAHALLQRLWTGRADELAALGAPGRSLAALADELQTWGEDTSLVARMGVDTHQRWLAALPELREACRRLDALGPGPTLAHGDLHQWNVMSTDPGVRIFDWTDAAISHPFIDPAPLLSRVPDLATRAELLDAYLSEWRAVCAPAELAEARSLVMVVGSLYQVQTYRRLLPRLLPDDVGSMGGADVGWLRRALGDDAGP